MATLLALAGRTKGGLIAALLPSRGLLPGHSHAGATLGITHTHGTFVRPQPRRTTLGITHTHDTFARMQPRWATLIITHTHTRHYSFANHAAPLWVLLIHKHKPHFYPTPVTLSLCGHYPHIRHLRAAILQGRTFRGQYSHSRDALQELAEGTNIFQLWWTWVRVNE